MHKILLVGKGSSPVRKFKKSLKQYEVTERQGLEKAGPYLKKSGVDLIIIDGACSAETGLLTEYAADTPRIVLVQQDKSIGKEPWLKDRLAFPLIEPVSLSELKCWIKKLIDSKSLATTNKLLEVKLRNRTKELELYDDLSKMFGLASDLDRSLGFIMDRAKVMTGARACSLLFNEEPLFEMAAIRRSRKINKFIFKKGVGIAGRVLENGKPLIVHDTSKDRRFNVEADKFMNMRIKSLICVPLRIKERVVGVLRALNKTGGQFTGDEMNLLANAANHVAVAIERAFLYQELKNDELTNLYNIRYLNQSIEMEMERSRRYKSIFSLVFMDIDDFKMVNERFGHLVGSRVLVEMAHVLRKNLRKIDIISRYGGDEFVMVLPQTPREACFLIAERLRRTIEKRVFLEHDNYKIRLTASFGVASFPDDARTKEDLLNIADHAMYRGKFSTKNIVFAAT